MRYILVSTEDSTIRKPVEVPDAIVNKNKRHKTIKRKQKSKSVIKKSVQKSKAVIRKHGTVHNNNKRKAKSL